MSQTRRKRLAAAAPGGEGYTLSPFKGSALGDLGGKGKSIASLFAAAGFSLTPAQRGGAEIESPFEQSWVVHLCCRLWARAVAQVPFKVWASNKPEAEPLPETDPLVRSLMRPNPDMTWAQLAEADIIHRKLSGESFWFLFAAQPGTKEGYGLVDGPVPSTFSILSVIGDAVEADVNALGQVTHWSFGALGGKQFRASRQGVVQFRDYDPHDPTRGLGAAEVANRQLQIAFQTERQQEAQQRSGGPGAFITYKDTISRESLENFQADIDAATKDPETQGQFKVLGDAPNIVPNPATPDKMQSLEVLRYSRDVVCSVMEVPVHLVSPDASTYSNLQEAWKQFWMAVVAYLKAVETQINAQLLPRMAEKKYHTCYFGFDYAGIEALREDQGARLKIAAEISLATGIPLAKIIEALALDIDTELFEDQPEDDNSDMDDMLEQSSEPAPAQPVDANSAGVQSQALNGAQVAALLDILRAVSDGLLTAEGAVAAIRAAFPLIDEAGARAIVDGVQEAPKEAAPAAPEAPKEPSPSKAAFRARGRRIMCGAKTKLGALTTREQREQYSKRFMREVSAKHERRAKARVEKWLDAYYRETLKRIRKFAATGELPTKAALKVSKDIAPKDPIKDALLPSDTKFLELLRTALKIPLEAGYSAALADQAAELGSIAVEFTDPRVVMAFEQQLTKVVEGVHSTTAQRVRNAIAEEITGDVTTFIELRARIEESLPELEGSLKSVFSNKTARAATIARTELGKASSTARDIQMRSDGVTQTQWITERDEDVRESHQQLDGEIRAIGQDFAPNLAHPHDERAAPEDVINCRCLVLAIVEDEPND